MSEGQIVITLQELQSQVEELAKKIDAPAKFFPTFGISRNDGTPNIEIGGNAYYYEAYDRDAVCIRRRTARLPRLLYWIFEGITSQMGFAYERLHKDPQIKPNVIAYQRQLELLGILYAQWRELREQENTEMLKWQSYQDGLMHSKINIDWNAWISKRDKKRHTEE